MKTHNLTIIASGLDPNAANFGDRFFAAGCDDATISVQKGLIVLEFDREAKNFTGALLSAVRDVKTAGANIGRIEKRDVVIASASEAIQPDSH